MPTYEYLCRSCGEQRDVVQSFNDPPLTTCANCGGELRKVFGNVGIVFKGSGFYKTDSRPSSAKSAPSGDADGVTSSKKAEPATTSAGEGGSTSSAASTPIATPAASNS